MYQQRLTLTYYLAIWTAIASILTPSPAPAAVIADDLDTYWHTAIQPHMPPYQAAWFGVTTATTPNDAQPIPATLPIRQAKLSYYLSIDAAYQQREQQNTVTSNTGTTQNLQQRRMFAHIEQFFIHTLYQHAPDTAPEQQCEHWHKQQELMAKLVPELAEYHHTTPQGAALVTLYSSVRDQAQTALSTQAGQLACTLVPMYTQHEVKQWTRDAVDNKLVERVENAMRNQRELMIKANAGLVTLERQLDAAVKQLPTADVFTLERKVADVRANLDLVVQDKMKIQELLQKMADTKEYEGLRKLFEISQQLLADSQAVIDATDAPFLRLVRSLEQVPIAIGHCQFRPRLLQHCQGLAESQAQGNGANFAQQLSACMVVTSEFMAYLQTHPAERVDLPDFSYTPHSTELPASIPAVLGRLGPYGDVMWRIIQDLGNLSGKMGYCHLWEELQDCRGLSERYAAITPLTPITKPQFVTAFNQCVTKTAALLSELTPPADSHATAFAGELKKLSTAVVQQMQP